VQKRAMSDDRSVGTIDRSPAWTTRAVPLGLWTFALGAGLILWFASSRNIPAFVGLATLLTILLAVAHRKGWWTFVGPVFFFEMVRTGRQTRSHAVRFLFAFILVFTFLSFYLLGLIYVEMS